MLPSSYVREDVRHSRVVAALDEAAPVTVPRSAVDYVVTEWGIATLRGKRLRQRIGELLGVVHPDCKADVAPRRTASTAGRSEGLIPAFA